MYIIPYSSYWQSFSSSTTTSQLCVVGYRKFRLRFYYFNHVSNWKLIKINYATKSNCVVFVSFISYDFMYFSLSLTLLRVRNSIVKFNCVLYTHNISGVLHEKRVANGGSIWILINYPQKKIYETNEILLLLREFYT